MVGAPVRTLTGASLLTVAVVAVILGPAQAAPGGEVYVVHGLPERTIDIQIDGESVATDVRTTAFEGPFAVDSGSTVAVLDADGEVIVESTVDVPAGESSDLVVHLPSSPEGDPLVTVFDNDLDAVQEGKSTVTVAHTAAVEPADIRAGGEVLFANVANGESSTVGVPEGSYSVDIVPTGETEPVLFGPADLDIAAGRLYRVYAVGNPAAETMNVAIGTIALETSGSPEPTTVDAGTGGQAARSVPIPPVLTGDR